MRQILENSAAARPIKQRFTSARPIVTNAITLDPTTGYNFDAGVGLVDAEAAVQASA